LEGAWDGTGGGFLVPVCLLQNVVRGSSIWRWERAVEGGQASKDECRGPPREDVGVVDSEK